MKPNLESMTKEELKRLLHHENFRFIQGLDKGASFDDLKEIRHRIRQISDELDNRKVNNSDTHQATL